jgi:hypothetical protein
MASREQFLDDYEISRLVSDNDDSEDDRYSVMILDSVVQKMKNVLWMKTLMMTLTVCTMLLTLVAMGQVHWFVSIIVFGWFSCLHRWTVSSIQRKKWIPAIYAEKTKQVRNQNLDGV